MSEMKFRVFLINAERFNNAVATSEDYPSYEDFGSWFDLPIAPSELGKVISEKLGSSADGYVICEEDIETGIECFDNCELFDCDIWEVNADATALFTLGSPTRELTDDEKLIIDALIDTGDYSVQEAVSNCYRYEIFDVNNMDDLGIAIAERNDVSFDSELADYINWDDYASDNTAEAISYNCQYIVRF